MLSYNELYALGGIFVNLIIASLLYLNGWISFIFQKLKLSFIASQDKDLIILGLRSELALYEEQVISGKIPKPRPTPIYRQTWVYISRYLPDWDKWVKIVKPETLVKWRRLKFTDFWTKKSKRIGRPPIDMETVELIRKIYSENYNLSPEKIFEQLVNLGLKNPPAPNTIAKYIKDMKKPPTKKQLENWHTFMRNHMDVTWAADFFTIPTIRFEVLYILIIIEHSSRKIIHFAVTKNPNMFWLTQQFRNATPLGYQPKYLIHDNDPVFKSKVFQDFLKSSKIRSKATSFRSPWQNPYAERVIGTIRAELLNHIIPFSERHLEKLLDGYINDYYNSHRTHQGLNGNTPIPTTQFEIVDIDTFKIKTTPVLNGLYHKYDRVA